MTNQHLTLPRGLVPGKLFCLNGGAEGIRNARQGLINFGTPCRTVGLVHYPTQSALISDCRLNPTHHTVQHSLELSCHPAVAEFRHIPLCATHPSPAPSSRDRMLVTMNVQSTPREKMPVLPTLALRMLSARLARPVGRRNRQSLGSTQGTGASEEWARRDSQPQLRKAYRTWEHADKHYTNDTSYEH